MHAFLKVDNMPKSRPAQAFWPWAGCSNCTGKVKAQAGLSRGGMTWLVRAKLATAVTGGAEGKPQVWAVH